MAKILIVDDEESDRLLPPPVIVVSGTGQFQLHMAEVLGARWTIQKPIRAELLPRAVDEAIEAAVG